MKLIKKQQGIALELTVFISLVIVMTVILNVHGIVHTDQAVHVTATGTQNTAITTDQASLVGLAKAA